VTSVAELAGHTAELDNANFIIGDAGAGSFADAFMTPDGSFPGVVIHAEEAWTFEQLYRDSNNKRPWFSHEQTAGFIDLGCGVISGIVFSIFAAFGFSEVKVVNRATALSQLGLGILGLAVVALVLILIGVVWTWCATAILHVGLVVGAVSAVFGASFEMLVHSGKSIIEPIHWVVAKMRSSARLILGALLLLLAGLSVAFAEECHYTVTINSGGDRGALVLTLRDPTTFNQLSEMLPFDRIAIRSTTTIATLTPSRGPDSGIVVVDGKTDAAKIGIVLLPCASSGTFAAAWSAFWGSLNHHTASTREGATIVYRGLKTTEPDIQVGPLRDLSNLKDAGGLVPGTGLAFAWAGGVPPYHFSVEDDRTGKPLAHGHTNSPLIWLAQFRTSTEPIDIALTDSQGATLWHQMGSLNAVPYPMSSIDSDIALFQADESYRLEVLKQLLKLSDNGDRTAATAVALIQSSGSKQ
jgi:hypothetical protein